MSYFKRPSGKFNPEDYGEYVQPLATFRTVDFELIFKYSLKILRENDYRFIKNKSQAEQFWRVYSYLKRPEDFKDSSKIDYHLFKKGIKPVWEVMAI